MRKRFRRKDAFEAPSRPRKKPDGRSVTRPVAVKGHWVSLAPPLRADYEAFYRWRSEAHALRLWLFGSRRIVTFAEFVPELDSFLRNAGSTMVVLDNRTALPIGFVLAYDQNLLDGWLWLGCYLTPEARRKRYTFAEGAALFVNYLFSQAPVRKLYAEVHEYNTQMCRLIQKLGFSEEERLSEHAWFGDQYWSSIRYSLDRAGWEAASKRLELILRTEASLDRQLSGS